MSFVITVIRTTIRKKEKRVFTLVIHSIPTMASTSKMTRVPDPMILKM